jgi:hypothetical protein
VSSRVNAKRKTTGNTETMASELRGEHLRVVTALKTGATASNDGHGGL